jgi:AcrR family transcriptional regulator
MVSALVSATARVLLKWGYDRTTTNRIAAAAGVSVGSVYQYFPSKESLVAALVDAHVERHMDLFRTNLRAFDGPDLAVGVRAIVESMLLAHLLEPELHAVLAEQVPKVGRMKRMHEIDQEAARLLFEKVVSHRPRLKPKNLELAVFMIVHGVEGILHALAVERPGKFETEEVIDELTSLVTSYLVSPR